MAALTYRRLMATDAVCERRCRRASTAMARAGRSAEAAWASSMAAFYAWRRERWAAIERGEELPPPTLQEWTTTDEARTGLVLQARFA